MEVAIFIVGVIQLILIFMFVDLTRDVKFLRESLFSQKPTHWKHEYEKAMYLGRKERALFCLQEFIWYSMDLKRSKEYYQNLKQKYESDFKDLGGDFPSYPY